MASSSRRDLYISVNGSVDNLAQSLKAGRSVLLDFAAVGTATIDQVEAKLKELSSGGANAVAELEKNFTRSISQIKRNADAVLSAPSNEAALSIVGANAAQAAAEQATQRAAALRLVAEAANKAAAAENGQNAALNAYATAAATAAVEAHDYAEALGGQAAALRLVENEIPAHIAGGKQVVAQSGQQRLAIQQLGFQLNDIASGFASGVKPQQIFAQQSGQVIQALQLMSAEGGGVLAFLGTWQGALVAAAAVMLVPFVASLLEGNDALEEQVNKLREQANQQAISDQAEIKFADTLEGVTQAVNDQAKALGKLANADQTSAEAAVANAKAQLQKALAIRQATAAIAVQAAQDLKSASSVTFGAAGGAGAGIAQSIYAQRSDEADARAKAAEAAVEQAQKNLALANVQLTVETAKRLADPIAVITKKYDDQVAAIQRADLALVAAGRNARADSAARITALEKEKQAALEKEKQAAANKRSSSTANYEVGRTIDVAEATKIIQSIGGRVTSGYRSTADQERIYADKLAGRHDGPVAKPGTSDHERGQAIDVAIAGVTIAGIKKAFAEAGVTIRQIIREPGQGVYHIAFGPKGKSDGQIAADEKRARDTETNRVKAYQDQLARATEENLQAQLALTQGTDEQVGFKIKQIENERDKLIADTESKVKTGQLRRAEADALEEKYKDTARLRLIAADRDEISKRVRDQLDADTLELRNSAAIVQLQSDLADTAKERRRNALLLLEYEEKQRRIAAQAVLDDPNSTQKQRDQASVELKQIDAEHPYRVTQIGRATADPLQAYGQRIAAATSDINEALKGVEANGIQALEDGLLGVISGTESVGAAFKKMAQSIIADLARIAIEKAIVGSLGSFLGLKTGGVSLDGYATGTVPGFAGGVISGPGTGTSDSILALLGNRLIRVSNGESIITAAATKRYAPLLKAMNDNSLSGYADGLVSAASYIPRYPAIPDPQSVSNGGGSGGTIRVEVSLTEELDARIDNRAAGVSVAVFKQGTPSLVDLAATSTVARLRRPSI